MLITNEHRTLFKLYEIKGRLEATMPNSVAPGTRYNEHKELLQLVDEAIGELRVGD